MYYSTNNAILHCFDHLIRLGQNWLFGEKTIFSSFQTSTQYLLALELSTLIFLLTFWQILFKNKKITKLRRLLYDRHDSRKQMADYLSGYLVRQIYFCKYWIIWLMSVFIVRNNQTNIGIFDSGCKYFFHSSTKTLTKCKFLEDLRTDG